MKSMFDSHIQKHCSGHLGDVGAQLQDLHQDGRTAVTPGCAPLLSFCSGSHHFRCKQHWRRRAVFHRLDDQLSLVRVQPWPCQQPRKHQTCNGQRVPGTCAQPAYGDAS